MTVLLGRTTAGVAADGIPATDCAAWKFVATASGTLKKIFFQTKVANAGLSGVALGVYSDGAGGTQPGNLLESANATGFTGTGAFSATLATGVAIVAGTTYWLAVEPDGEQFDWQGSNVSGVDNGAYNEITADPLPSAWPGTGATWGTSGIIWGEDDPGTAPANTVAPAVTGTPTEGQVLSCSTGTWTGSPVPTLTRQWQRDNSGGGSYSNISGATASTRTLTTDDIGCRVRCVVTGTNTNGNSSANSNAVGPVAALVVAPEPDCYVMTAGGLTPCVSRAKTSSGLFPPLT